jgi:hypothetical protein
MKLVHKLLFSFAGIGLASASHAVVLDFEDLTFGTSYLVGNTFNTSGVDVAVRPFTFSNGTLYSGGFTEVENGGLAGGSGNELEVNNVLLSFLFGSTNGLSLDFGEYGGNLNLLINGDFRNFNTFSDIDGLNIGGVGVSVVNGFGNDIGSLSFSGIINEFAIGGQELWIDNINAVPVPAAVWLFASGLVGLIGVSRRRYLAG